MTEKLKNFINSIRIPSLLSFFISKEGKINPTLEESLNEAPPAQNNWERLGLGKTAYGPVKRWMLFVTVAYIWGASHLNALIQTIVYATFGGDYFYSLHLGFLCDLVFRGSVFLLLGAHAFFMVTSWPRSKK